MLKKIANTAAAVSTFTFPERQYIDDVYVGTNLHDIRVIKIEGEPWFVAADICKALGLQRNKINGSYQAHLRRLDDDEKQTIPIIQNRRFICIAESGLYKLVMRSDKAEAKQFQDWVTRDVLPAIRKTGAYVKGEEALKQGKPLPEDTMKAMEDRLNAKFEQLFTMNQQLIQANHGLKEDVTRKQFVIEEMHDKVNTLAEDKAALESVKAETEPYSGSTICLMASMSC
nr:BRO family protein [uncultured Cohaesibacter sp.]